MAACEWQGGAAAECFAGQSALDAAEQQSRGPTSVHGPREAV